MVTVQRSIDIQAPADVIVRYLSDPVKLPGIYPNLMQVADVQRTTLETTRFTWELQMLGVHFVGGAELSVIVPDRELRIQFWGGIRGDIWLRLAPTAAGTQLEVQYEYDVPTPLLRKHTERDIIHNNDINIRDLLANLKQVIEAKLYMQPR